MNHKKIEDFNRMQKAYKMKNPVFKIICLFSLFIAFPIYVKGEEDKEAFQKAVQELKHTLNTKYFILRDEKIEYMEEFPENREDILREYQSEAEFYQTELNDITFKLFYEPKLMILPDGEKSRQTATMYHEMLKRYGENLVIPMYIRHIRIIMNSWMNRRNRV